MTGLIYLRARYMDPTTGTFLTRDPVWGVAGKSVTYNPYIYVGGNPTNYTDPSGKFAPLLLGTLMGAALGGGIELFSQLAANGWNWNCLDRGRIAQALVLGALSGFMGAGFGLMGTSPLVAGLTSFIVDFALGTWSDMLRGVPQEEAMLNNLISASIGFGIGYTMDAVTQSFADDAARGLRSLADDTPTNGTLVSNPNRINLADHELGLGGFPGHSIERHGPHLSLRELKDRILGQSSSMPQSRTASKFLSQTAHEDLVNQAIDANRIDIDNFVISASPTDELRLPLFVPDGNSLPNSSSGVSGSGTPTGIAISNTNTTKNPEAGNYFFQYGVRVSIESNRLAPQGFHIITAFPSNQ